MSGPAGDYLEISQAVDALIDARSTLNEPTVRAYMVARAALLRVSRIRGNEKASELAYKLADELVGNRLS